MRLHSACNRFHRGKSRPSALSSKNFIEGKLPTWFWPFNFDLMSHGAGSGSGGLISRKIYVFYYNARNGPIFVREFWLAPSQLCRIQYRYNVVNRESANLSLAVRVFLCTQGGSCPLLIWQRSSYSLHNFPFLWKFIKWDIVLMHMLSRRIPYSLSSLQIINLILKMSQTGVLTQISCCTRA